MTGNLFADFLIQKEPEQLSDGAMLLRGYVADEARELVDDVKTVLSIAPARHMTTPGGFTMSVAMTSCGEVGWTSDSRGYRYSTLNPVTGTAWPPFPESFLRVARRAAATAGFPGFEPDGCLINIYEPGTRLTLHQDKDERDYTRPIVSVSLGLPAVFLFGGLTRKERPRRILLESGDVVVWGGPARLFFHGVAPLKPGTHPLTGGTRINLTFRKAL